MAAVMNISLPPELLPADQDPAVPVSTPVIAPDEPNVLSVQLPERVPLLSTKLAVTLPPSNTHALGPPTVRLPVQIPLRPKSVVGGGGAMTLLRVRPATRS